MTKIAPSATLIRALQPLVPKSPSPAMPSLPQELRALSSPLGSTLAPIVRSWVAGPTQARVIVNRRWYAPLPCLWSYRLAVRGSCQSKRSRQDTLPEDHLAQQYYSRSDHVQVDRCQSSLRPRRKHTSVHLRSKVPQLHRSLLEYSKHQWRCGSAVSPSRRANLIKFATDQVVTRSDGVPMAAGSLGKVVQ